MGGIFKAHKRIKEQVNEGKVVPAVGGFPVKPHISGVLGGILWDGIRVKERMKAGDIDPGGKEVYCYSISDKASSVAGGVLKAILMHFNV